MPITGNKVLDIEVIGEIVTHNKAMHTRKKEKVIKYQNKNYILVMAGTSQAGIYYNLYEDHDKELTNPVDRIFKKNLPTELIDKLSINLFRAMKTITTTELKTRFSTHADYVNTTRSPLQVLSPRGELIILSRELYNELIEKRNN